MENTSPLPTSPTKEVTTDRAESPQQWLQAIKWRLPSVGWTVTFLTLIALALRLWELNERVMHHDESLDAWWSSLFLRGQYQGYDPVYHGPLRFYITAGFYKLFGETVASARLFSALSGTIAVALPYFIRKHLGSVGTVVASLALCISPTMLYYSRFAREDAQMVMLALVVFVLGIRYLDKPSTFAASGIAFALACSFAIKESTYLFGVLLALWLLIIIAGQIDADYHRSLGLLSQDAPFRPAFMAAMLGFTAFTLIITVAIGHLGDELFISLALYATVIFAVVALIALRPIREGNFKLPSLFKKLAQIGPWGWILALVIFATSWGLFFTVWGRYPDHFASGFTKAIGYWDSQQEVNRGGQPWYYYLYALPIYEWLFVALGAVGAVRTLRKPTAANTLFLWFTVGSMIMYSYAGERMPWLIAHPLLPLLLLAGIGAQVLWEQRRRAYMGLLALALVGGFGLTTFDSIRASFPHGADGREILSQAGQATPHLNVVLARIDNLRQIRSLQGQTLTVAAPSGNAWPYSWYTQYDQVQWYSPHDEIPLNVDVLIVESDRYQADMHPEHQAQVFAMRSWWVPSYLDASPVDLVRYVVEKKLWAQNPHHSHVGITEVAHPEGDSGIRQKLAAIDQGASKSTRWWSETLFGGRVEPGDFEPDTSGRQGCGSVDQWLLIRNDLARTEALAFPADIAEIGPIFCASHFHQN